MARLEKNKVRSEAVWVVVWQDATRGAGKLGRRRARCDSGGHDEALDAAQLQPDQRIALSNGATNPTMREALRKCYDALEMVKHRDAQRAAAIGILPAFEKSAMEFVDAWLAVLANRSADDRGEKAVVPPDWGWRPAAQYRPMRKSAYENAVRTLRLFRDSLPKTLTTGTMTGDHLGEFLNESRQRGLSPVTLNKYRRHLSAMFGALTSKARKKYFRTDPLTWFEDEVEALPEPRNEILIYTASDVAAFIASAENMADPNRMVTVKRRKRKRDGKPIKGNEEEFTKRVSGDPAPVLQWVLLLACTGVRRGEAEKLRWSDVDLEHGVLRVYATKTGAMRYVPLKGDPAGDVAPAFIDVLKAWRERRPNDIFVLPSASGKPCFPKHAWDGANSAAETAISPQGLRRTFESILAAIGFPASLAAFWLGHSVQVAESNYRAYRPGRLPGSTIEAALGLTPFLDREARGRAALRLLPRATGTE